MRGQTLYAVLFSTVVYLNSFAAIEGRYAEIVKGLNTLNAKYENISKIISIGKNDDENEIFAMRVSLNPKAVDSTKVGHLIVGTHHGNERHAATFTMAFLENLLSRFNSSEVFRGQLADTEWTIIPVLNISGYNANTRYEKGLDPNRDYAGPCIPAAGGKLKSISAMTSFLNTRIFSGSLTVHGYIGTLTYPWGVDTSDVHSHDHNLFEQITAKAAKINGYRYGTSTDIVYPADGTFEDYTYWKHGMWSLLLELESGSDSDIKSSVEAMALFFDNLNASPSTQHELTGKCQNVRKRNLRWE